VKEERPECVRKRGVVRKIIRILAYVVVGILVAALFALVFGFVLKWLWNWLMPDIFGLRQITYWQAFGLLLLAKLLFGRFSHHDHDRHDHAFKRRLFHGREDRFDRWKWGECRPEREESRTEDVREKAPDTA
jgi:hypothetical protein